MFSPVFHSSYMKTLFMPLLGLLSFLHQSFSLYSYICFVSNFIIYVSYCAIHTLIFLWGSSNFIISYMKDFSFTIFSSFISSWFNISILPYHFFQLCEILFSSCPSSEAIHLFLIILTYGKNFNHNYVFHRNIFLMTILIYWLVLLTFSTLQYFKCFSLKIFKRLEKAKFFINIS